MWWAAFTLVASLLWAIVGVIDKHVMDSEIRDPVVSTFFFGVASFIILSSISLIMGNVLLPLDVTAMSIVSGAVYGTGIFFYYGALRSEEVSKVMPIVLLSPLFVLILAAVFLGEMLTPSRYAGAFLLVIGAVLVSVNHRAGHGIRTVLGIALLSAVMFSLRDFFVKMATLQAGFWPVLFWASFGWLMVSAALFSVHHPKIRKKARMGINHLALSGGLSACAFLAFTAAISSGFVSLVSALHSIQALMVFLLALLLTELWPSVVKEDVKRSAVELKLLAIAVIIIGSFLIL